MEILRGEVVIDVQVAKALAEMEAATQQIRKSIAEIDQMDAEADVRINKRTLRRDIAELKSEIKGLEADTIKLDVEVDKDQIKENRANLKALRGDLKELESVNILVKVNDDELKDLAATESKLARDREKAARDAQRERLAEAKYHKDLRKAFDDELEAEGRLFMLGQKREAEYKKQTIALRSQGVELEKLRASYARLRAAELHAARAAVFGGADEESAHRQIIADLDLHREKILQLGGAYDDLDRERVFRQFDTKESNRSIGAMLKSLSSVRLQMGFFSATLRQAAIGFTVLGPIVFAVAGQIAALVGVLGTGLAGALAVSAAGLIGFAGAALGVGLIIAPMIGDLQDAKKASDAYGDAVRKYGRNSSQAQTAQEKLNTTLGDISPQAREAFASLGTMSDRWKELTKGNRGRFFETFANGIALANRTMPMFARESNKAFNAAMDAADEWIATFESPEAQAGLQQILSNFRSAIPGLNVGFISLSKSIGKIGASASRHLPALTQGFAVWADKIFAGLDSGDGLDAKLDRLVTHMQQIGHFAQSAGSMLASFFNAGANEGATLLGTLTNIFNRWDAWMNSTSGQSSLASFFSEANAIGSQFVATLANAGVALFEFSSAFAPLAQGFVGVISGITSVVSALMGLEAARTVVTAIGGALAGAFVASKFAAAATAIGTVGSALRTLGAVGTITSIGALTNPIIGLAAIAGGAVAALSLLDSEAERAGSGYMSLAASIDMAKAALDRLNGVQVSAAVAQSRVTAARAAYLSAQKRTVALEQEGKSGTRAYSAALADQLEKLNMLMTTKADLEQINKKASAATKTDTDALKDSIKATRESLIETRKWANDQSLSAKEREGWATASDTLTKTLRAQKQELQGIQRASKVFSELNGELRRGAPVSNRVRDAWANISKNVNTAAKAKIANLFEGVPKQAEAAIRTFSDLVTRGKGKKASEIVLNPKLNDAQVLNQLRALQKAVNPTINPRVNKGRAEKEMASLGRGKTATINTKANTKGAESSLRGLSAKRLSTMITVRANDGEAVTKLNRLQRMKLANKFVSMGVDNDKAMAAIRMVEAKKIADKKVNFDAPTSEADAANRRVQGFRDKTVAVRTTADLSGVNSAATAMSAITSKTVTVTTRYRGARAAGGPVGFASGGATSPRPAQAERHAASAERADVRQNRGGIYRRPSLLVGEENKKEFVISTNDSYRSVNEGYLRSAANEFGYDLAPIEMAAGGKSAFGKKKYKGMTKARKPKNVPSAAALAKTRSKYDWIRAKISAYETKGSNERSRQDTAIEAGDMKGYDKPKLTGPFTNALEMYPKLRETMKNMIAGWRKNLAKQMGIDKGISEGSKNSDLARLRARVKDLRRSVPKEQTNKDGKVLNRKGINAHEKQIKIAEKQLESAVDRNRDAKQKIPTLKDQIAQLKRELQLDIPNEENTLKNTIAQIANDQPNLPGTSTDSTPIGVQLGQLDASRYNNWRDFASNVTPAAPSAPGPGLPSAPGVPGGSASYAAAAAGAGFYAAAGGAAAGLSPATQPKANSFSAPAGGGTTVNQNISISEPPPDPHSFSKQLGWEAAAMVG